MTRLPTSFSRISFFTLALAGLACGGGMDSPADTDAAGEQGAGGDAAAPAGGASGSGGAAAHTGGKAGAGGTTPGGKGGIGGASGGSASAGATSHGGAGGTGGGAGKNGSAGGGDGGHTATGGAAGTKSAGGAPASGGAPSTQGAGGTPFGLGGSAAGGGDGGDGGQPGQGGNNPGGALTDYAPYFYTWGWGNDQYGFKDLTDLQKKSGITGITIAFVLSDGGCQATTDTQDHQSDVDAFRALGSNVKASFGGADGKYIENGCNDEASLASAIEAFIDATGIIDLDFDVEQDVAMNTTVNNRRAKALAKVQKDKGAKIAFTLAVDPDGLPTAGLDVVTSALKAGVTISHVNLMTMDYGADSLGGKTMGETAISSAKGAHAQLSTIIPGISTEDAWQMIGITPMIGDNDDGTTFSLQDAHLVADFAAQNHVGLLAFWAIDRDQPGSGNLDLYSGANKTPFDFHTIFQAVAK